MLKLSNPKLLQDKCFIGGEWVGAKDGAVIEVTNPATGELITTVPKFSKVETEQAVKQAHEALKPWQEKTAKERGAILRRWYDLMLENIDDLALIMTVEQGKPLAESKGEIMYAASFIEWFSEEAKRIYGDIIPGFTADRRIQVLKQPVGVCAAITPWNFPAAMITRKAGPALAVGCTMVIKPASQTPLSALALCVLAEEAGVPKGVLSCVTGSAGEIGGELTSNPLIRKLSFTGSTEIGKVLMKECADTVKRTSMELGGNAPFIVFEDADLDAAVEGAMASKYRNAGQTCVCSNRFLVHENVADDFTARLNKAVSELKVGDGTAEGTQIGPLIDGNAVEKVESLIQDSLKNGASLVAGGKRHGNGENFFQPTILADVTSEMEIFNEEIFGPVAPIIKFSNDEEAIEMANATQYGLAAYFYGKDISRIIKVSEALEYGMVGINQGIISTEVAPFGGIKESGNGREGSKYGVDEYLEIKYLCVGV